MMGISSTGFRLFCSPLGSIVSSVSVEGCSSWVSTLSSIARLFGSTRPSVAGFGQNVFLEVGRPLPHQRILRRWRFPHPAL